MIDPTRRERVADLDDELIELCGQRWLDDNTNGSDVENDYRRLCNEIMRLMLLQELLVFVAEQAADSNNNTAERQLRMMRWPRRHVAPARFRQVRSGVA